MLRAFVPRRLLIALPLAFACASSPASAEGKADTTKADALFNAGRSLLDAGEYADACPKFAEAQRLAPGLGVTLYLADCYERLGRTLSALTEFQRAEHIAEARADKRGAVAHERATHLATQVPSLSIEVPPQTRVEGLVVTRDGEEMPVSAWGAPVTLNPGPHVVRASAPGKAAREVSVSLPREQRTLTVTLAPLEAPAPEALAAPPHEPPVLPPLRRSPTRTGVAIALGGAGIATLATAIVLGLVAKSKADESNDGPCNFTDHCTPQGLSLRSSAIHLGNASTALFAVGAVAVGSGVIVYLTAPKTVLTTGLYIAPALGAGWGELRVGEAW
jgi:hypothetical protein